MATAMRAPRQSSSGWKTFLKPGWIITVVLVIAFSYAAIWILSPWQLNKDDALVDRNEHVERAFEVDPVTYSDVFDSNGAIKDDQEWMRITATGEFLSDSEVLLRMRPVSSTPAVQSLTPFRLDSGEILLVNRGFEPTQAGIPPRVDPPPSGEVTITGHARYNEVYPSTEPMTEDGYRQVYGINTDQISEVTGLNLGQDFLQLSDGSPGVVNAMPLPSLERGNHLSYGLQWIAFGVMAPLGLGYFIYSEIRERKRAREEENEMNSAAQSPDTAAGPPALDDDLQEPLEDELLVEKPEEPHTDADDEAEARQARTMRSRYGDSHKNYFSKRRGGTFN